MARPNGSFQRTGEIIPRDPGRMRRFPSPSTQPWNFTRVESVSRNPIRKLMPYPPSTWSRSPAIRATRMAPRTFFTFQPASPRKWT